MTDRPDQDETAPGTHAEHDGGGVATAPAPAEAATTGASEPRSRRLLRRPTPAVWAAIVAGLIMVAWVLWTYWPMPTDPADIQAGGPGDGWSGTAIWRALADEHLNPFSPGFIQAYNAPDGMPVPFAVNIQQWPTTLFYYGAARLVGDADSGQSLYMATGFVLSAASMAWLLRRFVVRDSWIAVLLGVALALQPLSVIKATGHTAFVHLWPIVLLVGAVLLMREKPTVRHAVIAGLVAFFAVSWSGYHLLLAGTTYAVMLLGTLILSRRGDWRLAFRNTAIAGATTVLGLVAIAVWLRSAGDGVDPTSTVRDNPLDTLTIYGARWYEYVVPPGGSILFGGTTEPFFMSRLHGSNASEFTIYMGNTLVGLAIAGVIVGILLRGRAEAEDRGWRRPIISRRAMIVAGVGVFLVAVYSSLPPSIYPFGVEVPTLSRGFHAVLTTWRVYSRFELVAAIGLLVLAAVGLAWLAGEGKRRWAVLAIATVVIPLDLALRLGEPQATTAPEIAAKIRALPPGPIAQFPLERGEGDGFGAIYHQAAYGRPVMNGFDDQPTETRATMLNDLSKETTVEGLDALGIRYVLAIERETVPPTPKIPAKVAPGLTSVATGMYGGWGATVYEVRDEANQVLVAPGRSFSGVPSSVTGPSWAQSQQSTMLVDGDCPTACEGNLELGLTAFSTPRKLQLKVNNETIPAIVDGKRVDGEFTLRPDVATKVEVPLRFSKGVTLVFDTDSEPAPVTDVDPLSKDQRKLTIGVTTAKWASPTSRDVIPLNE